MIAPMRRRAPIAAVLVTALAALTAVGCGGEETVTVAVTVRATTALPTAPVTPTLPATTPTTPPTVATGAGTVTSAAPLVDRPADFPTAAEAELLARLPESTQARCTRSTEANASAGVSASLYCDLGDVEGIQTYFESFPTRRAMLDVYSSLRRQQGVKSDVGRCDRAGVRPPGEGTWRTGTQDPARGRVMCFRNRTTWWYVWSQDDVRVLGWAFGPRLPAVRDYWINRSEIASG